MNFTPCDVCKLHTVHVAVPVSGGSKFKFKVCVGGGGIC